MATVPSPQPPIASLPVLLCVVQCALYWRNLEERAKISAKSCRDFGRAPRVISTLFLILLWRSFGVRCRKRTLPVVVGVDSLDCRAGSERHKGMLNIPLGHSLLCTAPLRADKRQAVLVALVAVVAVAAAVALLPSLPLSIPSSVPPLGDVDSREKFCVGSSGIGTRRRSGKI